MISDLNTMQSGITIDGANFNAFCCADDVLLASTTVTGLQHLIDKASAYIFQHGLRFNPTKTSYLTFGKHRLKQTPCWTIEGSPLQGK
jgi:hypothetical protein